MAKIKACKNCGKLIDEHSKACRFCGAQQGFWANFRKALNEDVTSPTQKVCPECKAQIPTDARKCTHCGSHQSAPPMGSSRVGWKGGLFLLAMIPTIFVGYYFVYSSMGTPAHEKREPNDRFDALDICQDAVRADSKFPSSVDFKVFASPGAKAVAGGYDVALAYTAKNGYGNTLPMMAHCQIRGGALASLITRPR